MVSTYRTALCEKLKSPLHSVNNSHYNYRSSRFTRQDAQGHYVTAMTYTGYSYPSSTPAVELRYHKTLFFWTAMRHYCCCVYKKLSCRRQAARLSVV